jgi:hypothetical protein
LNSVSIQVNFQKNDKNPPYRVKDKSHITYKNGEYTASLLFADELSSVLGGRIDIDGEMYTGFYGKLVNFSTSNPRIHVIVQDAFGNMLEQDIDLSK